MAPATLQALIESFVLREGTDYGEREYSLEEKAGHVMEQLRQGKAHLTFDEQSRTCSVSVKWAPLWAGGDLSAGFGGEFFCLEPLV
ncbi:MAG: YheU family protein, partial [Victivallales bacterium]|nr:YheU family protein [Victivallales bacterium]